ncbi:MAG: hypothetical protein B6D56_08360 [Candidatus Omnitrophica bacterium 4484_70.1]|nr:MAG: hypothetical protein B6D56_08360 [Candidatus Omnitrophica bacterium 4484_70.1]
MKRDKFSFNLSMINQIGIGFFKYTISPRQNFLTSNTAFAKILGYSSKKELASKSFSSFFVSSQEKENFFSLLKKKRKVKFFEALFLKKNKRRIWVAISAFLIRENHNEFMEGIIEDITQYKKKEEKLALEKDFLENLLDNIPDAVYFKDRKNRIIKVNKFYLQGMKKPPEEIIGKTDFDFFPYEQAKQMFEDDNYVLRTGKPIVGKIERTLLPDGRWNQVITTKIPMYDKKGKIIGTMGITRDMTAYAHLERERLELVVNSLEALGKVLEIRDPYTYGHTKRVAYLAQCLAKELGWDENRILGMRLAGQLHDIGKIGIPTDILVKSGPLTELEYKMIQAHVEKGYQLLKGIKSNFPLAEIVYQHHERLDGSGYPQGLKGEEILEEARILAVCDVLEAMTHRRPYREAKRLEEALEELRKEAGIKYDKRIVNLLLKIIKRNNFRLFWVEV